MSDISSDITYTRWLIHHMENPCIEPRTGLSIGSFYVKQARDAVKTFIDPVAKETLTDYLQRYVDV